MAGCGVWPTLDLFACPERLTPMTESGKPLDVLGPTIS
jgi:hypothetical protein